MDKKKIVEEIQLDIKRGIYDSFPVLKSRLLFISEKLIKSIYIVNQEAQLSRNEMETLLENEYIRKEDFQ
jgi:hypothetical protein